MRRETPYRVRCFIEYRALPRGGAFYLTRRHPLNKNFTKKESWWRRMNTDHTTMRHSYSATTGVNYVPLTGLLPSTAGKRASQ